MSQNSDVPNFIPREVIMFMGDIGTGKTTAALNIALNNPDNLFHYLMADRDPSKLYEEIGGRPGNWLEYDAFEFANARGVIQKLVQQTRVNWSSQWIIVDTIGQMYKTAADQYGYLQYGKSITDVVSDRLIGLKQKQDANKMAKADQQLSDSLIGGLQANEWNIIKQYFYGDIMWPLVKRSRAHLILICHPNPIDIFKGKFHRPIANVLAEVRSRFEELGEVPDLHKDVVRFMDTIIYMSVAADSTKRSMYTIKETGRRNWLNVPTEYTDFWPAYQNLVMNGHFDTTV